MSDNQKVGRVPRTAVNGRGDDNIAGGKPFHQLDKLRPVGLGAGDPLAEYLFASGRLQLGHLAGFVLGGSGDARIAINHAVNSALEICIKKAQFVQGPGFDANIETPMSGI
jgi:hypothetical protein